jgi:predicted TIM-barrel fold metal-dependent hydrolase
MTIPFVDAHVHLWRLDNPQLDYGWAEADSDPVLGSLEELHLRVWDAERFAAETRHVDLRGVVHVQAAGGDPVGETRWLAEQHAATGIPTAIIARADLLADDVEDVLDRHLDASSLMRGVRDMGAAGRLGEPALDRGLAALAERGLSWDLHCFHEEMAAARDAARRHADLAVVLGHAGFPLARDEAYRGDWARGLAALADADNVMCKISGLGMADHGWTVDSWRPWVQGCLDAFGPQRCMVGSNWPIGRLYSSYEAALAALETITADLSNDERTALFAGNAARHYAIGAEVAA